MVQCERRKNTKQYQGHAAAQKSAAWPAERHNTSGAYPAGAPAFLRLCIYVFCAAPLKLRHSRRDRRTAAAPGGCRGRITSVRAAYCTARKKTPPAARGDVYKRQLHIIGTKGEIKGVFDDSVFTVRTIDTASESGWREEVVDLAIGGDKSGMTGSHGGGDLRLVEDFVRVLQGEQPSISCTNINDSLNGHLAVFQAEKARKTGTVCTMPQI